jgi:hypothetical protein
MEQTNIMAKLSIYGDNFNPQVITDYLNIQPEEWWLKGDNVAGKATKRNKSCWRVSTGYQESLDVNNQLSEVIKLFQGKSDKLIELIHSHNLEVFIAIVVNIENNQKPAIYFDRRAIKFVHEIEAQIDIDLYVYS